jgi:hypothetical protein
MRLRSFVINGFFKLKFEVNTVRSGTMVCLAEVVM